MISKSFPDVVRPNLAVAYYFSAFVEVRCCEQLYKATNLTRLWRILFSICSGAKFVDSNHCFPKRIKTAKHRLTIARAMLGRHWILNEQITENVEMEG